MSQSHNSPPERKGEESPALPEVVWEALCQVAVELEAQQALSAMVLTLTRGLRQVGLVVLVTMLLRRDMPYRRGEVEVRCPKCHGPMVRLRKLVKVGRYTLLGKLVYARCRYHCPVCGERIFPLDESLSLMVNLRGHSLELASDLVLLCAVMPFAKGCELFERMRGFRISTRLACALTRTVGQSLMELELERAEQLWKQRYEEPERFEPPPAELRRIDRHERVYVMMDNSKAGIQEGKRGRGAPKERTLRKQLLEARRKAVKAAKRGKAGPEPPAEPTFFDELANEDSWRDVRALKGWKSQAERKACAAWVHGLLDYLAEGKGANVLQRLRRLRPSSAAVAKVVSDCIKYFEDHQCRMHYAFYRSHDMLIGSGPVESVHGWVIQARCGLPGMRWSVQGIDAMLRLRCSWASGRWDEDFALAAARAAPSDRTQEAPTSSQARLRSCALHGEKAAAEGPPEGAPRRRP